MSVLEAVRRPPLLVLGADEQWATCKLAHQPALGLPLFAPTPALRRWLLVAAAIIAGALALAALTHVRTRRFSPAASP